MRAGLAALALLATAALAAPLLAPHDPDEIADVAAARYLRPGSELLLLALKDGRRIGATSVTFEDQTVRYLRGGAGATLPVSELADPVPQRRRFPLGTDAFGRDLLSRILHGARVSLGVGLLAVALGVGLGAGLGALSGYAGGPVDAALMRLVDVLHAVPRFFLFLACAALFGPSAKLLVLVLGLTGWMGIARITRGQVLSIRERAFVEAARALGGGAVAVVSRHVLPQCSATIAVATALLTADTILAESSLSFIGLGVQPPAASWGNIIAGGRDSLLSAWWVSAFPGMAILATVLLLHAAGRRLADPRADGAPRAPLLK